MSTRIRAILLSALLVIALGGTFLAGSATIQAFHSWQQQEKQSKVGDVRLISYWMTLPHISHLYHVPEIYLYSSLHLKKETTTRSKTLAIIAIEKHESVDEIIHETQAAVVAYRKLHPTKPPVIPSTGPLRGMIPMLPSSAVNPFAPLWYIVGSGRKCW